MVSPQDVFALYHTLCPGPDFAIFAAQGWVESKFDPDAVSACGAQGVAQFLPATFQDCIAHGWVPAGASPLDPAQAITAQRAYMLWLQSKLQNNQRAALAAYNAGIGHVQRLQHLYTKTWESKLPLETYAYVRQILTLSDFIRMRWGTQP